MKNATVLFARPVVNPAYQDRLRNIQTTFQLSNVVPEIDAAFYFDLALKAFLAVKYDPKKTTFLIANEEFAVICREMLLDGSWKKNNVTNYVTCDDYEPKISPKRFNLNLRSYLQKVWCQLLLVKKLFEFFTFLRNHQNRLLLALLILQQMA